MHRIDIGFFIARRLSDRQGGHSNRVMTRVALLSVVIGVAVMIVALSVILGFKHEISSKVAGFGSHVRIVRLDGNVSYETRPVSARQPFVEEVRALPWVRHVHRFALKAGIMKTGEGIQGVVLKGVDRDFDPSFFRDYLTEGEIPAFGDSVRTKDVLISETLARLMKLRTGDRFEMLFVQDPPRRDRFKVKGIYDSQLPEFDRVTVLTDLRNVQRLNGWGADSVTGFEVGLDGFTDLEERTGAIDGLVARRSERKAGGNVIAENVKDLYPNLFEWLEIQDVNVAIIVTIMLLVSGFTMVSAVLILLLERTSMIGILKAMGMRDATLQRIFLLRSARIVLKGMIIGNAVGLACCLVQRQWGPVRLDASGYFLTVVPVYLDWGYLLLLNAGCFVVILLMQVVPTFLVTRISPQKTVKYE